MTIGIDGSVYRKHPTWVWSVFHDWLIFTLTLNICIFSFCKLSSDLFQFCKTSSRESQRSWRRFEYCISWIDWRQRPWCSSCCGCRMPTSKYCNQSSTGKWKLIFKDFFCIQHKKGNPEFGLTQHKKVFASLSQLFLSWLLYTILDVNMFLYAL